MAPEIDLDEPRFSREFELPPDPANNRHKRLKITYADCGYRNEQAPEEEHVLLFCGPMMATRWMSASRDTLAKKHKVRMIQIDRPGFGGTDEVNAADRVSVCRAIHVALLEHLGIKHVSLAAHSAGTVFALDLALHNPEILHPERPYIAIAGPWILPSHTGSVLMSMTNLIPGSMMKTEKLVRTIVSYIGPALGFTFKASQLVVSSVYTPPPRTPDKKVAEIDRKYAELERNLYLGKIGDDVFKGPEQRIFAESIRGLNDESVVLMHKGAVSGGWSDWGDFDVLVPRLGEKLRSAGRKLRVDVWYAESDALIGDDASKGPAWFDGLWQAAAQNGSIEYHREAVKGSDHDSVWNLKHGRCRKVFEYMSGLKEEVVEAADE